MNDDGDDTMRKKTERKKERKVREKRYIQVYPIGILGNSRFGSGISSQADPRIFHCYEACAIESSPSTSQLTVYPPYSSPSINVTPISVNPL